MEAASRNRQNISPIKHFTLVIIIVANRDYRTIGFQANCVAISGRNRYNISPIRHLTLAVRIVAHRNYRTIGFQANRVIPNSRNRHNICPTLAEFSAANMYGSYSVPNLSSSVMRLKNTR